MNIMSRLVLKLNFYRSFIQNKKTLFGIHFILFNNNKRSNILFKFKILIKAYLINEYKKSNSVIKYAE